jgi:hypothetical protein
LLTDFAATNNQMLINEVELNPAGTDIGAEKVELYNPSNRGIDISGGAINSAAGRTSTVVIS